MSVVIHSLPDSLYNLTVNYEYGILKDIGLSTKVTTYDVGSVFW